ncbi:MAG TPA: glycosyltransferase [Polyangiaceae bacterium]|nr:glycosyltransferase [Polyangiaceae bacterium]
MQAFLLEPDAGGRISGGYLYNARIAEGSAAVQRRALSVDAFGAGLDELRLPNDAWLIADSLFLSPEPMAALERACRGTHRRRAMLLHALPSFIERAGDRAELARSLPLRPTPDELALLETLDLVLAPGPLLPRLLAESGARVRAAVCPPGVDRPEPAPFSAGSAEVRLVSIGSVTPLKGFIDGVEALGALREQAFRWTIVGHLGVAPDYVEQLRSTIGALGLSDRVELAGQLDHAQTLATLRASDLLLLTSFTENHPLVALEALMAHVPIVGYAVGGLPDIVRDGETGLLSPLLDVPRLSQNLARALGDRRERARLADGCARAAAALPTWAEAARSFERVLEAHER